MRPFIRTLGQTVRQIHIAERPMNLGCPKQYPLVGRRQCHGLVDQRNQLPPEIVPQLKKRTFDHLE